MLLYAQLAVALLVGYLNIWLGIIHIYYVTIWWWDIPTHYLAGMWVGFFAAWFLANWQRRATIVECALFALAIGMLWEIFEVYEGIGGSPFMPYWVDTIKDVMMDVLGGATAGYIAGKMRI
jgi:hypothetical protein